MALQTLRQVVSIRLGKSRCNRNSNPALDRTKWLRLFTCLPTELQIMILSNLDTHDLLNFRLSSKLFHEIIDSLGPALTRHFVRSKMNPLMTKLYPPPPPDCATLKYMLEMEHRLSVSRHLAAQLCHWFVEPGLHRRKTKKDAEQRYLQLFRAVVPLIFTLNHFFEQYRGMILDRAIRNSRPDLPFSLLTGGPTLWDDQASILAMYHPNLMLDCYHIYGYLLHVFEHRLTPSRIDYLKTVFSRSRPKMPCTPEVEVLLMLGGLEQVHRVLKGRNYCARRTALDSFVGSLNPATNSSGWRDSWTAIGVDEKDVSNLRLRLPALHLVWVPCALKMLLGSKIIHRVDFSSDSMARDPAEFIVDLINWNAQDPIDAEDWEAESEEDEEES